MAEVPLPFAGVLRGLRTEAGMTQEELAEAAGLSSRAISYLERGEVSAPHKDTVRLLADALGLAGPARAQFEAAARGRGGADGTVVAATRTLPRDVASFTGRQRELAELADAMSDAGTVVSIRAIGGMAGVGKTAFAVHAAHRLADRFPGGQIFVPLHGHTPGQQPADPADALATLLVTMGVPVAQIPAGLEARAALWRDRVAHRQLLLILDDAVSSEQVWPLLPGSGGSMVLVTSRRHLSALDDATPISLDTLPPGEAAQLLARLAGRAGLAPEDPAVGELARLCGFLPLAIGMVASQLRHHPAWTPAGRAGGRTDRRRRPPGPDGHRERVRDGRVRPGLRRPRSRPAAAVPPAGTAPGHGHRRVRRRRAGRLRPGGRPARPGRPVRPVPAHRGHPGPLPGT